MKLIKTFNTKILVFVNLLTVLLVLTGCTAATGPQIYGSDVINLYHSTAEWIVDGCMTGQCGTFIYTKGDLVVYARPFVDNIAFIVTDKGIPVEKLQGLTGNLVNMETWADFKAWLGNNGYVTVVSGSTIHSALMSAANTIAGMELVPILGIMLTPPNTLPEWVVGESGQG